MIDLRRIEDADPNQVSIDDLRAMAEVIRAAHDVIGWTKGEGRPDAGHALHERLRVALGAFDFGEEETA